MIFRCGAEGFFSAHLHLQVIQKRSVDGHSLEDGHDRDGHSFEDGHSLEDGHDKDGHTFEEKADGHSLEAVAERASLHYYRLSSLE